MTGYRDEEFSYKQFEIDAIQSDDGWTVRVYIQGKFLGKFESRRRKDAIALAKAYCDGGGIE